MHPIIVEIMAREKRKQLDQELMRSFAIARSRQKKTASTTFAPALGDLLIRIGTWLKSRNENPAYPCD